ncbi:unnamed protein product [Leptosia nina]|uniref:ABC transporter domain-containing protein n=1 Tax=Leptosia nina TaxID=320188 RepID=A0AAV1IYX6_9NEOP
MGGSGGQLRLLLWKDYLMRKRKPITIVGLLWAVGVISSICIVRYNIDNQDFPTCQFAARALPSAGLLTFLQSFICNVNNDCSTMEQFEEIPTYENSKLTQLKRQLGPVIYNESVIEVAGSIPDALKLLATIADVADEPTFLEITKNGLKVEDIFQNPKRVKRYLMNEMEFSNDVTNSLMSAHLGLAAILEGDLDRCSESSMMRTIRIENPQQLTIFVHKLCSLSEQDLQKLFTDLLLELDIGKYVTMAGNMYEKVSGDQRVTQLGRLSTAVLRMLSPRNFLPPELNGILYGDQDNFSYVPLSMINKLMNLFQPTFQDTVSYKTLKDFTDALIVGIKYLNSVLKTEDSDFNEDVQLKRMSNILNKAVAVAQDISDNDTTIDAFSVLTRITNLALKFLTKEQKHNVLFYSTLLSKLVEVAHKMININTNIHQLIYDVSLRNPKGVRVLLSLPLQAVAKGLDGLADPERAQIITSNIDDPVQPFCDLKKIRKFFLVSKDEAMNLKSRLCTDAWKIYVNDMITSFGTYEAKANINAIASLFIMDAVGSDISDQLYAIDKDFEVLKNFTQLITDLDKKETPNLDWNSIFDTKRDAEFLKVVKLKENLGKLILLTVHGCLAKEVVIQNPLLEFKVSPFLKDTTTMVTVVNEQLALSSKETAEKAKKIYPDLLMVLALTALDEKKTFKSLSTPSKNIFCHGVEEASAYLSFPDIDRSSFVITQCDVSNEIENALNADSVLSKGIAAVKRANHSVVEEINWTKLIRGLKEMYMTIEEDYPYVLEFRSYGMDKMAQQHIEQLFLQAKSYWFSLRSLKRICILSINIGFRVMDLLDYDAFNLSQEFWLKIKYYFAISTGPMNVINDFIELVHDISKNTTPLTDIPLETATIMNSALSNLPNLVVETVDIVVKNDVKVDSILNILNSASPWPCGSSLTELVQFSPPSNKAVQSLESLICFNKTFQGEWKAYLDQKNVTMYKSTQWNVTKLAPHVFLKFAEVFDRTLDNFDVLGEIFQNTIQDSDNGKLTIMAAWKYTIDTFNTSDGDVILRKFFTKVDAVINSINISTANNVSLHTLWQDYINCTDSVYMDNACRETGRATWTNTLKFISMAMGNFTDDFGTYMKEANAENATILQMVGFTSKSMLYKMYEKVPELIGVLINSYWDLGFMQQVRRASLTQFWDCEALLTSLNPGPDSSITPEMLRSFEPLICPSMLYWLSMPTGANSLLDIIAKPQYLFFTLHTTKFSSNFNKAYVTSIDLLNVLRELGAQNAIIKIDLSIETLKSKLENTIDAVVSYRIEKNDPSYIAFNEMLIKQSVSTIYLTRTVAIVNRMSDLLKSVKIDDVITNVSDEDKKAIENDIISIKRLYTRRASEIIGIHFDVITDVLWTNRNDFKITNALEIMCDNLKNNDTSKEILGESTRIRAIICSKQYKIVYSAVQHVVDDHLEDDRRSLSNIIKVLQNESSEDVSNIFEFIKNRSSIVSALKRSIKYASDLDIPIYLQYLHSNIEHYNVILNFLAGNDWWGELRSIYTGPLSTTFLDSVERIFDIADDVLHNLDKIRLVKVFRDVNINNTESFCLPNMTLSDYIPDGTGLLSSLHHQICGDKIKLFKEIPPLLFASQGYEEELSLPTTVNYHDLNGDITRAEALLASIVREPQPPQLPVWVTEHNVARFKSAMLNVLTNETLTKISFGLIVNVVDASTLYLKDTYCGACSQVTSWAKQITLQLFKKPEYENFLCSVREMDLDEIYLALKNHFHWDMAIGELIATRNYTKYELNKSINEMLEQIKLNLLEDMTANRSVLECLEENAKRNHFSIATLANEIIYRIIRLFRADLPHLQDVAGFTRLPYVIQLQKDVAHNLDVSISLEKLMQNNDNATNVLGDTLDKYGLHAFKHSGLNLFSVNGFPVETTSFKFHKNLCKLYNCTQMAYVLREILNSTLIKEMISKLPELQEKEFWRFNFIANILEPIEAVLEQAGMILRLLSRMDMKGVFNGNLKALIDFLMQLIMNDSSSGFIGSIKAIVNETAPLLQGTVLETDILALADGLQVLTTFRNYIVDNDINITLSDIFTSPHRLKMSFENIGLNNSEFWKYAPNLYNGHISLKPLFSQEDGIYNIRKFVCEEDSISQVLIPGDLDSFTSKEFDLVVKEQFCLIDDVQAKSIVPVLIENINFSFIMDKVKSFLLSKLYAASNLTAIEGNTIFSKVSDMATLIPLVQQNIGTLTDSLAKEPLIQRLKGGFSIGGLMSSPEMLADVGNMVCGKPFFSGVSRFYKSIVSSVDLSSQPEEEQLQALPTDFCRSVYTEVVNMEGGKIVWSFIKPLLMGKILYTPPSHIVQRIIEKANGTFSPMVQLFDLVHSFAHAFSSVDRISAHKAGLIALHDMLGDEQYQEIRVALLGNMSVPRIDLDELLGGIGDTESLGRLLMTASNFMRCVNLDRFKAVPDEHKLTEEAVRLTRVNEFTAGLVFLNATELPGGALANIEYKIRVDIDNAPTTKRTKNYLWTPGPEAGFLENMRYFRGFIQIQDIIEKAIIQLSASSRTKREVPANADLDWSIYTQQNPYPCYRKDLFQTSLYESQALIVAFFFSFLFTVSSAVRFILADKESGNTMLMSVMGVNLSYHTFSWFLCSLVEMSLTMFLACLVLYYGHILPRTAPSLTFTLLFIFGLSVLSFCYLMGKLFKTASVGAICAALGYLTTFMPFVLILSLEAVLTSGLKIFVSLSMSSSLCYAFLFIGRFEAMGIGAGWAQLWDSPDNSGDMNIAVAAIMMLVDACLYFVIGYLVEMFWGLKKVQSNVTHIASTDEKAGVSIINITKVYGRGSKPALAGVSVELRPGQVTTLLGHNGAGKSTLLNILTGMLKPTSGQVVIRSDNGGVTRIGVCPQRDVLYEHMTAREHVYLYARLRQAPNSEIDSILKVVSLGHVSSELVSRLSGGTRRRLCVALAFVGQPHLVTLDEPTSGVDPQARREIWSMIMKLRENRTILLTTHHLDEAELLSDQVVIMHKGHIHTTGSPIEIKRSLGSGYKLTVSFDKSEDQSATDIEEKTKTVLEVTKNVVKNASLLDVSGREVEINVPFYDEHGVSNDFETLCSTLEQGASWLEFRTFNMECTSLEQVFFNICNQEHHNVPSATDTASKSASTSSIKTDSAPLVPPDGPLKGTSLQQFKALLYKRYTHYMRNRWLLFLLIVLPSLFVTVAMGFATIRPPADNEVSLKLDPTLYEPTTDYLIPRPTQYFYESDILAREVMAILQHEQHSRNWTSDDSLICKCVDSRQQCEITENVSRPNQMLLPDVDTLNEWLVTSQQVYIEKRYGGYSSSLANNITNLISWYNNKGHHALPAYLNHLNRALLRAASGDEEANLTLYTHPLKISNEQLNKDNVYQHIADAGISAMLLIGYSLVSAGAAIYLVTERMDKQKRLQLLCGVSPTLYWSTALFCDMLVIVINMAITVVILKIFNFPVFVARNNLPAICVLTLLYGFACSGVVYVAEKFFTEASLANMVLFCGNTFVALSGIALLLVLDIISDSDETDHARWVLHKIFMLSPQFVLADGLLEIAKNTIQAQVLGAFGMDTYRQPFGSNLVLYHYIALIAVGALLFLLNLAIEYHYFDDLITRFGPRYKKCRNKGVLEQDVQREERRVTAAVAPLRLRTIGNINAGFVDSKEDLKSNSLKRSTLTGIGSSDVISCVHVSRLYPAASGYRIAVDDLTLGIPPSECTALLGQNGAGKSSTFSMLTAELRPSAGQIYFKDEPVNQRDLCQGLISYCPQRDALDSLLTVRETLQFFCTLRGLTSQDEIIKRTMEQFELVKYSEVRCGELSGGNKRKVCTAVAFMGRNPLVLLDEPTSGMDPGSRTCVSSGWARACAHGRAVLVSTHALQDARRADRVALLKEGSLAALAPLHESLARFGGGYVVCTRVCDGFAPARDVWHRVSELIPHATLTVAHATAIHFIVPTLVTVDEKEVLTPVSMVFHVMSDLQREGLVEDFTLNQTSLEQMFLKSNGDANTFSLESSSSLCPSSESSLNGNTYRRASEDLSIVTAL